MSGQSLDVEGSGQGPPIRPHSSLRWQVAVSYATHAAYAVFGAPPLSTLTAPEAPEVADPPPPSVPVPPSVPDPPGVPVPPTAPVGTAWSSPPQATLASTKISVYKLRTTNLRIPECTILQQANAMRPYRSRPSLRKIPCAHKATQRLNPYSHGNQGYGLAWSCAPDWMRVGIPNHGHCAPPFGSCSGFGKDF